MQEELICPYPGLRPFNEDESIFFKGRDEHIEQITRQLEEKKFLMLTGASGDGKSSLVYAGLIPNARAGFFKAKFGNWIVVDFRPERTPLKNLADALSDKFGQAEKERFQNELQFGFSALIDIYTQSPYYVNKNSVEFLSLEEAERKKAARKGANLMILVDQFEEFFTNTENYSNGKTSVDAQLVVNLILETSRIALEKDIPIYVICTMRSDYIGQCASFRGLPEAIGFSQFFVPRLKRNEVYQVIQEPALLNGNKISKRLIEVLINEMNDGIDQLPVLQHALNQIWQMAENGKEEMDLIHFAKIGGLSPNYLPKDNKSQFENWFHTIPDYKKSFFEHPSLDNVLDGHANDLYFRANHYLKSKQPNSTISIEDTQLIIRNTFKCLTKIDQSRGVRNRMTLAEIVNIIDQPHITKKEVALVIEIFRLQGNTFIKPFYFEGEKENDLHPDTVLDITHESLIRNWTNLIEWAHDEDEDYHIWEDFQKQLKRWVENDKSSGYLLPIGSLNFFETWISQKKPNKYWLVKYNESNSTPENKLIEADKLLKDAHQFIKKSARKLFVSRTILKYGAEKIAVVLSTIIVLISCVFLYFGYVSKQNHTVLANSEAKGIELLQSPKVKTSTKAKFILIYENAHPGTVVENLQNCGSDSVQIRTALEIFNKLGDNIDIYRSEEATIREATAIKSNISDYLYSSILPKYKNIPNDSTLNYDEAVKLFWLSKTLEKSEKSVKDTIYINKLKKYQTHIIELLYEKYIFLRLKSGKEIKNPELFNVISYYLLAFQFEHDKIEFIIDNISPFEGVKSETFFNKSFPKQSNLTNTDLSLKYNGGYELLASLYAYNDNDAFAFQAIDSIMAYAGDYHNRYNFGFREVAYSHWLGSKDSTHQFIEKLAIGYAKKGGGNINDKINNLTYENLSWQLWLTSPFLFLQKSMLHFNRLDYYTNKNCANEVINWYQKRLWSLGLDADETHFQQANIYKYRAQNALIQSDTIQGFQYLNKFKSIIETMNTDYLEDSILFGDGNDAIKTTRRILLLYPNYVSSNNTWTFNGNWNSSINYIYEFYNNWNLMDKYNFNENELNSFLGIFYNDFKQYIPANYFNRYKTSRAPEILNFGLKLKDKIQDKDKKYDFSMLMNMMETIDPYLLYDDLNDNFLDSIEEKKYYNKEYYNCESKILNAKLTVLRFYLFKLVKKGKIDRVFNFINAIENKPEKNNVILDLSEQCLNKDMINESTILLKYYTQDFTSNKKPPVLFYLIVSQIGGRDLLKYAYNHMRDADDAMKPSILKYMIRGMAQKSEYYQALSLAPTSMSSNSELEYINEILRAEFLNNSDFNTTVEKSWISDNFLWTDRIYETQNSNSCYCTNDD